MAAAVWPSSWPRSSSLRWLNSRSRSPAAWEANSAPSPGAPYLHKVSREGQDQWPETCLQKMTIASDLRLFGPLCIYIHQILYTSTFILILLKTFLCIYFLSMLLGVTGHFHSVHLTFLKTIMRPQLLDIWFLWLFVEEILPKCQTWYPEGLMQ